ncbi:MAG: hypothetical protein EOM55_01605 [Clostridia bacterium]|nr:hypothetical protein [Clostridia bacterium]
MDYFWVIINFLRSNFFYDLKSSIVSISFILLLYFLNKLLKDKGDKLGKTLQYLLETAMCFATLMIVM